MAGQRSQGPVGVSGDPPDINDGTLSRVLSPRPGPHVNEGSRPNEDEEDWSLSQLVLKLNKLRNSSDGRELEKIAVYLFGPQCFSIGVIAGIGLDLINTAVDLFKMVWMFVLADLHDLSAGEMTWRKYASPKTLFAEVVASIYEEELREAAAERDALLKELGEAFKNPGETFENVSNDIVQGYANDWQEYQRNMASLTLDGQYNAGKIFGGLLVDIIGLLTGVAGLGKSGAKLASKLPKLASRAKKIGTIKKKTANGAGRSGVANASGSGGGSAPSKGSSGSKKQRENSTQENSQRKSDKLAKKSSADEGKRKSNGESDKSKETVVLVGDDPAGLVKNGKVDYNNLDGWASNKNLDNEWGADPEKFPSGGFKYKTTDGTYEYQIHGHGPNPVAVANHPGSNAASGPTASITRKPVGGGPRQNMRTDGTWGSPGSDMNGNHIPLINSPF